MGIKEMYYGLEEKYYKVLDAIDKAGIPIYKLVNPIDKVIPSFAIVLIVLGLVLIYLIFLLATSLGVNVPNAAVTVYFLDKGGNPASDLVLTVTLPDGNSFNMKTTELGSVSFLASPDDVLTFSIPVASGEVVTKTLIIGEGLIYKIALDAYSVQDTINFSVNSLDSLGLKEINLDFYCSNPNASVPDSVVGSIENDYSVLVDPDCGKLLLDVKSSSYNEEYGIEIFEGASVNLQPLNLGGDSSIILSIYDASSLPVNDYSATISQNGIPIDTLTATNTSVVTFGGLAVATYLVSINKSGYFPKTQTVILTPDVKILPLTLTLEKDLAGTTGALFVSVVEAGTTKKLKNAKVSFYNLNLDGTQSTLIKGDAITNENGLADATVLDITAKYWLVVSKDGYKTKNIKAATVSAEPYPVSLALKGQERMLVVKVLDDENKAVSNAVIAFYDIEGNVVEPKFGITDINGIAKNVVEAGVYQAYVYKGLFSGFGDLFTFDDSTELPVIGYDNLVHIVLPKAAWEITLQDQFGQPVQNALVELFDAYAPEPYAVGAKYASPQGLFSADNLRADKKYYALVSSPSFENYISVSKFLTSNAKTVETFVLEKQKLSKKPTITFLGIEDSDGKSALKLGAGNLYKAKFKLTLPYNKEYKKLYATFLAGNLDIVEKEQFYIDKVNASGYTTVMKGRAYVENDEELSIGDVTQINEEFKEGSPFEDNTKWAQLYWDLPKNYFDNGVLFVDVYLKVKEGTLDGTQLPFSYNIRAETSKTENAEEEILFDPLDENPAELSLFNSKKQSYFTVGDGQQICDDKFCIELSVLDVNEDIKTSVSGDVSYISTLGKDYELKFSFMNNNPVPLTNYRVVLEMPQENICMNSGWVKSADNISTNIEPDKKKFDDCFKYIYNSSTVPLMQNGMIKGDLIFTPIKEGTGSFKLTVIEDKSPIYSNEFYIDVVANKDMNVLVEPEVIPAYINTELKFTATDAGTGAFLNNANVKIVDVYDTVLVEGQTDPKGEALLGLPKQLPNIDLYLKVTKENYRAFEKNLKTSSKFIKIEPEELKVSVVVSEKFGKSSIQLTNISKLPVEIIDAKLTGNFDEYVDVESVNEYLKTTNKGKIIDAEHSYTLPISVSLTNLADSLQSNREYTAELKLYIGPKGQGTVDSKWEYTVPVTLQITMGKGLDNIDCLGVDSTKTEFISTSGKNDQDEVTIVNGCTVGSKPVPMYNLEAKVNWKGNGLGSFVFNKDNLTSKLQSAYYVTLANKMVSHDEQMFVVDFMPLNGKVSGSGTAEVNIRAGFFTDGGVQFVEKKLEYNVSVLDLTSCISYVLPEAEVDLVKVPRDAKGAFSIKNDCDASIDLQLKILPDQFIDVKPLEFTVPGKGEKQIVIDPKNSPIGVYLLDVYGKTPKAHYEAVHAGSKGGLRIFIAPLPEDCVVLDNYEFNLTETDGKTDAERYTYAINKCYFKDVKAVYDLKVTAGGFGSIFAFGDDEDTCVSENWQGMLGPALVSGTTSGWASKMIGETFYGADRPWGLASDTPEELAAKKATTAGSIAGAGSAIGALTDKDGKLNNDVKDKDKANKAIALKAEAESLSASGDYEGAQKKADEAKKLADYFTPANLAASEAATASEEAAKIAVDAQKKADGFTPLASSTAIKITSITRVGNKVTLNWSKSSDGEAKYVIDYCYDLVVTNCENDYLAGNLLNNSNITVSVSTEKFVRVRAGKDVGYTWVDSGKSAWVEIPADSAAAGASTVPSAPINLNLSPSVLTDNKTTTTASWDEVEGATKYRFSFDNFKTDVSETLGFSTILGPFNMPTQSKIYTFYVKACNDNGCGEPPAQTTLTLTTASAAGGAAPVPGNELPKALASKEAVQTSLSALNTKISSLTGDKYSPQTQYSEYSYKLSTLIKQIEAQAKVLKEQAKAVPQDATVIAGANAELVKIKTKLDALDGEIKAYTVSLDNPAATSVTIQAPKLESPGSNEKNVSLTPTFTWSGTVPSNGFYRIHYKNNVEDSYVTVSPIALSGTYNYNKLKLLEDTMYSWYVGVCDKEGSSNCVKSEERSFTTTGASASATGSTQIQNFRIVANNSPSYNFNWDKFPGVLSGYMVLACKEDTITPNDGCGGSLFIGQTTDLFANFDLIPAQIENKKLRFAVGAKNAAGNLISGSYSNWEPLPATAPAAPGQQTLAPLPAKLLAPIGASSKVLDAYQIYSKSYTVATNAKGGFDLQNISYDVAIKSYDLVGAALEVYNVPAGTTASQNLDDLKKAVSKTVTVATGTYLSSKVSEIQTLVTTYSGKYS